MTGTVIIGIAALLAFAIVWRLAGQADRAREQMLARRDEELRATTARLWGDQFPVDATAARESRGDCAGSGNPGQLHNQNSSDVLMRRSEGIL